MTSTASQSSGRGDKNSSSDPDDRFSRLPQHVAIIMDGNGRWAKARSKPRSDGHRAGYENVRNIVSAAAVEGVKFLTLFAFSTENWDRPTEEVSGILDLAAEVIKFEVDDLHSNNVQVKHVGRLDRLPQGLQTQILEAVELTKDNTGLTLGVAFDYGGRYDIVQAARQMVSDGLAPDEITEESVSRYLFTASVPDPDLIVRTGGEFRISNFLIWQSAYAEFYSTDVFWPDFDKDQFRMALEAFAQRDRRFGRV